MGLKKFIGELEAAEKCIKHALNEIEDHEEYCFDEKELRLIADQLQTLKRRAKYNRKASAPRTMALLS